MTVIEVRTEISGNVWKIEASPGDRLQEDDPIMILESMKMEIPVAAPDDGTIVEILVTEGAAISEDDIVARLEV